jgi:hypothetical protein
MVEFILVGTIIDTLLSIKEGNKSIYKFCTNLIKFVQNLPLLLLLLFVVDVAAFLLFLIFSIYNYSGG